MWGWAGSALLNLSRARRRTGIERITRTLGKGSCARVCSAPSLAGQKKYGEAQSLLLEGYQGMTTRKEQIDDADRFKIDLVGHWIDDLYRGWGKPEQAANWRENLVPPK